MSSKNRAIPRRKSKSRGKLANGSLCVTEQLEVRWLMSGYVPLAPTASPAWETGYFTATGTVDLQGGAATAPNVTAGQAASLPRSISVNGAGLPLLESRPNGQGLPLFIDMSRTDGQYGDFSLDSDRTTFNFTEELAIYDFWRKISGFYSQFNVNVTDVLPATGTSDPNFAWMQMSNEFGGGAAYVNSLNKSGPTGRDNSSDVTGRVSGTVHEFGHILGLGHQSDWDRLGNLINEYSNADGYRNVPIMGVDYDGNPNSRWWYGRADWGSGPGVIQDDVQTIANSIAGQVGGDGFRPDDFGNTTATAYALANGSQQLDGYIERYSDADVFKITPTAPGPWNITATPLYGSQLRPNLELLDANGNVIAARNDTDMRNGATNEEFLNLNLTAGTYYVRVTSNGDYDSLGYYKLGATQLPGTFTSNDVGIPAVDGSVSYNASAGIFTQSGGGNDIWNTTDQFRYTYETLTGDGSITARVDSLDNIGFFTKAGVMIRQSLAGNSAHAYVGLIPNGGVESIWRSAANANAANVAGTSAGGPWVRISRSGNLFTYLKSTDGMTWTTIGTTTISMSGSVLIGLATCCWDTSNPTNEAFATFSNVSVTGNTTPSNPTYNNLAAPATLAAAPAAGTNNTSIALSWAAVSGASGYVIERSANGIDFGQIGTVGSGTTTFTDANVWGAIRWFYRVSASNGTSLNSVPSPVASTVNRPNAPGLPSYTAPMIIRGTSEFDINFLDVQGETGYRLELSTDGGNTYSLYANLAPNETSRNITGLIAGTAYKVRITPFNTGGDGPALVFDAQTTLAAINNLRFTGRTSASTTVAWDAETAATGYYIDRSTDGVNWGNVATLGATSSWTDTNVTPGTEYYYRVFPFNGDGTGPQSNVIYDSNPAASLPAGWADVNIGTVNGGTGGGGAAVSTGTGAWKVVSAGNDVFGTDDSFNFTYRQSSTDNAIIARIDTLEATDPAAKAGLVIRQDLTTGSKSVAIMINAGNGYGIDVRTRTTAGAGTGYQQVLANVAAPYWLKLARFGSTITASYSTDGTTWTTAATISNFTLTGPFYIGLGVTALSSTQLNTSAFSNVSVGTAAPTVATAATAAPSPVTAKTTNLSVLGADDGGESNLTYTWTATGPATVSYSDNGTNAAKNSTATFSQAGSYTFTATITDVNGNITTSTTTVVVNQTLTSIAVTPTSSTVYDGQTSQFRASANDQFGSTLASQPTFTWSVTGAGGINTSGLYTAPASGPANDTVKAASGSIFGNAAVTVTMSVIQGTPGSDSIRLVRSGGNLLVYINSGSPTYNVSYGSLSSLMVAGGTGIDNINIDFSGGSSPVPAGGLTVNGSGGSASLTVTGTSGADAASVNASSVILNGSTVGYISLSGIIFNGNGGADVLVQSAQPSNQSSLVFNATTGDGPSAIDTLNISSGSYTFAAPTTGQGYQPISISSLIIGGAATVSLSNATPISDRSVLMLGSLSMAASGTLDLGSNDLILHNSNAASASQSLAMTTMELQSGFNAGAGIRSSTAASDSTHLTTLGVFLSSVPGAFDSQSISTTDVLVKHTYFGDASLDGKVDGSDYSLIDNGYLQHLTGWHNGDFNYDGIINASDYTLIDNAFNQQGASLAASTFQPAVQQSAIANAVASTVRTSAIGAKIKSQQPVVANVVASTSSFEWKRRGKLEGVWTSLQNTDTVTNSHSSGT